MPSLTFQIPQYIWLHPPSLIGFFWQIPKTSWWRSRHRFEGSRSSTNWAGYESTSKEVQGCTQWTHPRVMGSNKFMEAHWAWSPWATKNRHLDSSSRKIQSRLRIGNKYFGSILEGSGCMAILGTTFFPLCDVNPVKNNETQQQKGTQDRSMDRFEWNTSTRCLWQTRTSV